MNRPNKKDYLTTNQFEYNQMLNKYYDALEAYIDILEKQLILSDVSGMFSAEQMEQAYNDGVEAEQQRCGEFNIENYCFSNDL